MAAPGTDRRRWVRYPSSAGTFWRPIKEEGLYSARIQDISCGGVRLVVNQPLEPGTLLQILINKEVEARLVHATPTPDNKWALGCEFTLVLSEDEIKKWMKRPDTP
jgi:PilZ domain